MDNYDPKPGDEEYLEWLIDMVDRPERTGSQSEDGGSEIPPWSVGAEPLSIDDV